MDVTQDYWQAVLAAAQAQGQSEEKVKRLRSAQLLRSLAARTEFTKAAIEVANNILALRRYLKENQRDYAQLGKLRESQRDRIEEEVGSYVRACSANIDKLQQTLQAAAAEGAGGSEDLQAHRQGMVLILSERLRSITAAFDRLRSLRYQQLQQQEANRLRRLPQKTPPRLVGRGPRQSLQQAQQQQQQAKQPPSPQRPGWRPQTTGELHGLLAAQRPPWQAQQAQQAQQPLSPAEGAGSAGGRGQQQQQQVFMDQENKALQLELISMGEQVQHAERTVREIATLNQMFSTTIMHQSEQIEKLYTEAVDATHSLTTGNVQLRKAIKTNSSARKYMLIFLLVASLGLLFLDWWSS